MAAIELAQWRQLVADTLAEAQKQGASQAEVFAAANQGFSLEVREGQIETLEYQRDKSVGITVYFGQRKGSASTSDHRKEALLSAVTAACHIAKFTQEDPCVGLADPALLAYHYPDLNLYHPWSVTVEEGIALAKECEALGKAAHPKITQSEGASFSTHEHAYVYGNTHGFIGDYQTTSHSFNCILLAKEGSQMQRDYSYTVARDPKDLYSVAKVAQEAAARTARRLNARRLTTRKAPVIFEARVASGLLGVFLQAIKGGNLYRKASFLVDHLGKPIFPRHVHIYERPHLLKGLGSAPFDEEGVKTTDKDLIKSGVLQSYLLGSYAARKLGMQTTGHAGGAHNVFIESSADDFSALLKKMGTGLLVTELMGQGINLLTGDYSRGASGFWVENGVVQYSVEEITIAGNLKEMFQHLVAVGSDVEKVSNIITGSILLENMTIAGE